jgi:ABC-type amino acid transport substrate-binding protein
MIPVFFNFPNAGKLLTLLFIPFAGWLSGAALVAADYPALFAVGIPSYFAKAQVALPFLLDLFGLPHDLFQLYIPTTIITGKFDSLVTAMNLLVFALLGAGAMGGFLVFEKARLLRAAVGVFAGTAAITVLLKVGFALAIDTDYRLDDALRQMHQATRAADTVVHRSLPPAAPDDGRGVLERARERGSLRIGYDPVNLPMSFFNVDDELVGFDVELAERMAGALGLRAEFVPVTWPELPRLLADGVIDVMPGMWYRPYWFSRLWLTEPYFTATIGLAVRDERRHDFDTLEELRRSRGLKIGVPLDTSQLQYVMQRYFDGSDTEFVTVEFWSAFFNGEHPELDAFLMPAEHATGWSLLHPEYTVVVPHPDPVGVPTAFGVPIGADDLARVIDEWIRSASSAGVIDRSFEFWVMGKGAQDPTPRWSIVRNVLGWVE